jgi:hypothetical protein
MATEKKSTWNGEPDSYPYERMSNLDQQTVMSLLDSEDNFDLVTANYYLQRNIFAERLLASHMSVLERMRVEHLTAIEAERTFKSETYLEGKIEGKIEGKFVVNAETYVLTNAETKSETNSDGAHDQIYERQAADGAVNRVVMFFADGVYYAGEPVSVETTSKGYYEMEDGGVYYGEIVGGILSGYGLMVDAAGNQIFGLSVDGKRQGMTLFVNADGSRELGYYEQGVYEGLSITYDQQMVRTSEQLFENSLPVLPFSGKSSGTSGENSI